jgi:hypothetical protein
VVEVDNKSQESLFISYCHRLGWTALLLPPNPPNNHMCVLFDAAVAAYLPPGRSKCIIIDYFLRLYLIFVLLIYFYFFIPETSSVFNTLVDPDIKFQLPS